MSGRPSEAFLMVLRTAMTMVMMEGNNHSLAHVHAHAYCHLSLSLSIYIYISIIFDIHITKHSSFSNDCLIRSDTLCHSVPYVK